MNTVKCPHCKKDFELDQVFRHQVEEDIKIKTEAELAKKFEEKNKEVFDLKKELDEQKKKYEELNQKEQEIKKKALLVEDEKKKLQKLELSYEKRKKEDQDKIREETAKEASEKYRFEKLQWEKQKADMQKAIDEAQRKGNQGSQQAQGEVMELDLEEQLKVQFPGDEFLPIPKGVEGGDIWQKIRDEHGNIAGSILWETKRTKAWRNTWLPKLREDARKINASESILISEVLPDGIRSSHRKDGVWISNYEYAINTARFVRYLLMKIAVTKTSASHKDDKLQAIYDYISSDNFKHKFEAHQENVKVLREDLTAEKRATEIRWKKREAVIERLDRSSAQMYVELQGIVPELPDIEELDLLEDGQS